MFFLVSRLSKLTEQWQPSTRCATTTGILILGLFDELPKAATRTKTLTTQKLIKNDTTFYNTIKSTLPKTNIVFQIPIIPFPEKNPIKTINKYEPLQPFFFTKRLQFSYKSNKKHPQK